MHRTFPPLSAIRVFECAARHLSFTRAAGELGMTQAAVSYQIKLLEERAGTPLFRRGKRGVSLSEAGLALAGPSTAALDRLSNAFALVQNSSAGLLRVAVMPTFATAWLARHLGVFQFAHAELAVQVETTSQMADFSSSNADVCICCISDETVPKGLISHKLLQASYSPMLSPSLLERIGGLHQPADLLRYPLIDPQDAWWGYWFSKAGVDLPEPRPGSSNALGAQHLQGVAALAGQGVAMLTPFFFAEEKATGRLTQPFPIVGQTGRHYRLVYPHERRNVPKIRAFRDWLLLQFSQIGLDSSAPFTCEEGFRDPTVPNAMPGGLRAKVV